MKKLFGWLKEKWSTPPEVHTYSWGFCLWIALWHFGLAAVFYIFAPTQQIVGLSGVFLFMMGTVLGVTGWRYVFRAVYLGLNGWTVNREIGPEATLFCNDDSVDGILEPFAEMREKLRAVSAQRAEAISERDDQIATLQRENSSDSREAQRAMAAADRINWMLENPVQPVS